MFAHFSNFGKIMVHCVVLAFFLPHFFYFFAKKKVLDCQNVFFGALLAAIQAQLLAAAACELCPLAERELQLCRAAADFALSFCLLFALLYVFSLNDEAFCLCRFFIFSACFLTIAFDVCRFFLVPAINRFSPVKSGWFFYFEGAVEAAKIFLLAAYAILAIVHFFAVAIRRFAATSAVFLLCAVLCAAIECLSSLEIWQCEHFFAQFGGFLFAFAAIFAQTTVQNPKFSIDYASKTLDRTAFLRFCRREMSADRLVNLFLIRLKNFDRLGALCGHSGANEILREFARRLTRIFGASGVFRAGKDDFVAVCKSGAELEWISENIFEELCPRFDVDGAKTELFFSVCALAKFDIEKVYYSIDNFVQWTAKVAQKSPAGEVCFLNAEKTNSYCEKIYFEAALQNLVAEKRIAVFYQPILEVESQKFAGAEVLARFFAEGGAMLPAAKMFEAAEECALSVPLGEIVREKACAFASKFRRELSQVDFFCLNLSPSEVAQKGAAGEIEMSAKRLAVPCEKICVEFSARKQNFADGSFARLMEGLEQFGAAASLDNFDFEKANFAIVAENDFKMAKFGRAALLAAERSRSAFRLLKSAAEIIHKIGAKVAIVGIESEPQFALAKEIGADYVQGFFFAAPMSEEKYIEFLASRADFGEKPNAEPNS